MKLELKKINSVKMNPKYNINRWINEDNNQKNSKTIFLLMINFLLKKY